MKVTIYHEESSYGMPVILDDAGNLMKPEAAFRAARERLRLTNAELAPLLGVSVRTVEGWDLGRPVGSAAALNMLGKLLEGPARARENRRKQKPKKKDKR